LGNKFGSFIRFAVGLAFLSTGAYIFWICFLPYRKEQEEIFSALLFIAFALLFTIFSYRLAQIETRPRLKRALGVMAIGGLSNAIGETIWFYK
jgi:hypothetical protein